MNDTEYNFYEEPIRQTEEQRKNLMMDNPARKNPEMETSERWSNPHAGKSRMRETRNGLSMASTQAKCLCSPTNTRDKPALYAL